jgi:hypothetical protein
MRAGEIAAAAAIIIALLVFVLRPLLTAPRAPAPAPTPALGGSGPTSAALPGPIAHGEAPLPATSLRRVADVVKSNATESAVILKDWIRKAS